MAAVVRVKRRRDELAADSFVLVSKRQRLDEYGQTDNVHNVFKFAGTLSSKDSTVSQCVKEAIRKVKIDRELQHHAYYAPEARVKKPSTRAIDARYKITTTKRGSDFACLNSVPDELGDIGESIESGAVGSGAGVKRKYFCLYDIEQEDMHQPYASAPTLDDGVQCNGVNLIREKVPQNASRLPVISSADSEIFVYDLYYMNSDSEFDFQTLEDLLTIEAKREDLVNDWHDSDEDENDLDEFNIDSESCARNDYPEEDPDFWNVHRTYTTRCDSPETQYFNYYSEDIAEGAGYEDLEYEDTEVCRRQLDVCDIDDAPPPSAEHEDYDYRMP